MQESESNKIIKNSKVADSGGKMIFENDTLCSQLLRDYSGIEVLKDVKPEDIEDVTERFIPMFTEEREADVVKKVHLSGEDIFITLIEHKSSIDYNVNMQILRYMAYIWEDFENQMEAKHPGISHTKGFKYPPILPIVYYEDSPSWTADDSFKQRIALGNVFGEYIPDFRYLLISLNSFEKEELLEKRDGLSLVMLINRIRNAEEFKELRLPDDYLSSLLEKSPQDVLGVIARVTAVVLRKINVPEDEIQDMVDRIKERKHMALFDNFVGYDVQEERRRSRAEGAENLLIRKVCSHLAKNRDVETIAEYLDESEEEIRRIAEIASKYAPEYDVDKIREELNKEKEPIK